ncbi:MAG: hypoxanthine phosphoribosyltransferase [Bacteroidetes bacterium]|nr:hypoxanthine phosphoribosyltransferase [Bacteroidota bacterium]MCW5896436.1 hypoxanthine phosphoribosyltransferase [Bacteroidota bacterium]
MPFNKKSLKINGDRFVVMLSERRIKAKVKELARTISKDYKGTVPVFIGILNGSFIFFSDLIREVSIDCEIDFLKLSSYGDAKISSGNVRLLKDLNCQVEGRDIIIVEDIIDSGLSMEYIRDLIRHQNPKSFRVVTLLYKKDAVKTQMKIDYIGFSIPKDFVIGYGLDYAQKLRHLKAIYRLKES